MLYVYRTHNPTPMSRNAVHPLAADTRAYRNLLYLSSKGVIPTVNPSARMAATLHNANLGMARRKEALQTARAVLQYAQAEANKHFVRGSSSIPARKAAQRAARHGYRRTGQQPTPNVDLFLKANEDLLRG